MSPDPTPSTTPDPSGDGGLSVPVSSRTYAAGVVERTGSGGGFFEGETPITLADLARKLSHQCEYYGGQTAWAKAHGISLSQVCETINGRREPSESIINALGYLRVVRYLPKRKNG